LAERRANPPNWISLRRVRRHDIQWLKPDGVAFDDLLSAGVVDADLGQAAMRSK
jgi:hypothetical protein